jgi:hypothetical protein
MAAAWGWLRSIPSHLRPTGDTATSGGARRRGFARGLRTWRVNARAEPKLGVDRRKKTLPPPPRGRSAVSGTHVGST